ncbi:MAG TPA: hypothetical protein VJC15_01170 [Candidatus Paceibacterota bacterium]
MPDLVLMEIYRLPSGKSREEFETWYPRHLIEVLDTNLLNLVQADIKIGNDEYPRIVTIRTTQENFQEIQRDPAIVVVLQDAEKWGATVFPITTQQL